MNLNELFNIQAKLDERIEKEHGLEGQDLLDKKILALQVELGELANEQRSWKFWSKDQEPTKKKNVYLECGACEGSGIDECKSDEILETVTCEECEGDGDLGIAYTKNPLLEEYVDCLHFILSIGNDIFVEEHEFSDLHCEDSVTECFLEVFESVNELCNEINFGNSYDSEEKYTFLVEDFIVLGKELGFTWNQIEQAYLDKNKINHERQNTGY